MFYVSKIEGTNIYVKDTEDNIEESVTAFLAQNVDGVLGVEKDNIRVVTNEELINSSLATQVIRGIQCPLEIKGTDVVKCLDKNIEDIVIPYGVTSIESDVFCDCKKLYNVEIPDSVVSIGSRAFEDCTSLHSIKIPKGVMSLSESVFCGCTGLRSVKMSDSITSISRGTFAFCESLRSIKIPDGVTSIEYKTFYGCKELRSVEIPDSVLSIDVCAFNARTKKLYIKCTEGSYASQYAKGNGIKVEYL